MHQQHDTKSNPWVVFYTHIPLVMTHTRSAYIAAAYHAIMLLLILRLCWHIAEVISYIYIYITWTQQKLILFVSEKFVAKFLDFIPFSARGIQSPSPLWKSYTKLYFDAKHLVKGLNREWWNVSVLFLKKCSFRPVSDAALIL